MAFRVELSRSLKPPQVLLTRSKDFRKFQGEGDVTSFQLRVLLWSDAPPFSIVLAGLAAYAASDPSSVPTAANEPSMYQRYVEVVNKTLTRTNSWVVVIVPHIVPSARAVSYTNYGWQILNFSVLSMIGS